MKKWQSPHRVVDREVWSISPPGSGGSGQLPGPLPAALHSSSSRRLPLSPGEKISSTGRSGRRLPRARRGHRASASSRGHPLPANECGGTAVACLSGFENPRAPSNAIKQVRRIAWNRCLQRMLAGETGVRVSVSQMRLHRPACLASRIPGLTESQNLRR